MRAHIASAYCERTLRAHIARESAMKAPTIRFETASDAVASESAVEYLDVVAAAAVVAAVAAAVVVVDPPDY